MTNQKRELIRTNKNGDRENVPFEDHPFTKITQLMLILDPQTKYRIDAAKRPDAKKWGLI